MSTHPNVILLLTLTPDDLARKTHRAILDEAKITGDADIPIGKEKYHHAIMEADYDDGWQIGGNEGDIIIFDLVTYGYGEQIEWDKLVSQQKELEEWATGICERHHCRFKISVTANYW